MIVISLGLVAISLLFGRTIATSFDRIGESAEERQMRKYKEARELAGMMVADGERASVDGESTSYQKELLKTGYWEPPEFNATNSAEAPAKNSRRVKREISRDEAGQTSDNGTDSRLAIQARREEMRKWSTMARESRKIQ